MVTSVQNKLKKFTIFVDISIIGFNANWKCLGVREALFICTLRWKHAVATFFIIWTQIVILIFFMGGLRVVYV